MSSSVPTLDLGRRGVTLGVDSCRQWQSQLHEPLGGLLRSLGHGVAQGAKAECTMRRGGDEHALVSHGALWLKRGFCLLHCRMYGVFIGCVYDYECLRRLSHAADLSIASLQLGFAQSDAEWQHHSITLLCVL